uniref:MARVEL domain-containing protein n=1 Tax=Bubo bubo TaxID=30461 RepID=A0A8C0FSZ7_BUBBB
SPLLGATNQARAGICLTNIFSIVVFGSIVNECYVNKGSDDPELLCIFNENESACSYGIAVGIIAFFGCIFFFVVDLYFQQISSVKDRKRAVLLDLGFSGFLSFLWFVAFCFLANQWQRTKMSKGVSQGADAARAAITFSFFSIIVWVTGLTGWQRDFGSSRAHRLTLRGSQADSSAAHPGGRGLQKPPFAPTSRLCISPGPHSGKGTSARGVQNPRGPLSAAAGPHTYLCCSGGSCSGDCTWRSRDAPGSPPPPL